MRIQSNRVALLPLLALALTSLSACVDEKIVYRDRELFEEVPSAAADFVGYTDHDAKLTVCGNCHVEKQTAWEGTVHATAWDGLQSSDHASAACEGCHTVNELGNVSTGASGYMATQDARYEDVQCEACHGPGLSHVSSPTGGNVPLAPLAVGTDLTAGCGECHQDTHHPFVEEWAQSRHAVLDDHTSTNASCNPCHTGEGALKAWGITNEYLEKSETLDQVAITCAVCHDPHGSENTAQLRFPISTANVEDNLCMKCHHKRGVPDPTSTRGPHSPEGPVLIGEGGWWPPSMEWEGTLVGTHGTPEANPRLCAGCHVVPFQTTDADGVAFSATGHVFAAIPCMVGGLPTPGVDCANAERNYQACTGSGCHGSEAVARSAQATTEARSELLAEELNALIAQVPATEFNSSDSRYTVGEGAKFNAELALVPGSAVHNPFLIESLLIASIKEVRRTYGLAAQSPVDLTPMFKLDGVD
jgi:predicted CXXCH cytochrome family protein